MDLLIGLGMFLVFLMLGLFVGGTTERRHLYQLDQRERDYADMLVTQIKSFPRCAASAKPPALVIGEVVIATDYLKSFLASLKKLVGGEIRSYETMQLRARREALLRLLEVARSQGYNAVCNVRLETADVGGNSWSQRAAMVAILASGTAYQAESPTP